MTASVGTLLELVGIGFLCAAAVTRRRVGAPAPRSLRLLGTVADGLVGVVALADGAVSVLGDPDRVVVWSVGSIALVVAVVLLALRRRTHPLVR